jgi:hypothetical protein
VSKDKPPTDPIENMMAAMWDTRPFVTIGLGAPKGRFSISFGDSLLKDAERVLSICEEHGMTLDSVENGHGDGWQLTRASFPAKNFDALVEALRAAGCLLNVAGMALVVAREAAKSRKVSP